MLLRVCFTVLRIWTSFTDFYRKLYRHGIQSFLLCVLSIAMSVPSVPTAGCSVALSLCAVLPIALMIVNSDGTPILSLHTTGSCPESSLFLLCLVSLFTHYGIDSTSASPVTVAEDLNAPFVQSN
jgi:hypothetical protein